ncbi:centrosome and spindle pole-associated protein 1-like isoform X2 [Antennarius striatus]|uniref:centrosome and spindle pole-associated protein 1-like isoform X2 n=1 Tax=Antennarius striatus TaxID=241820 RepID=UPI0035B1FE33
MNNQVSLEMDDELENFLRERKARVAEDKARLEQDPPYMEMKVHGNRDYKSRPKENIPPKSTAQEKESSIMGLPLGVEYERKKQRLREELRMDYRQYMDQKKQLAKPGPLIHLSNGRSVKHGVQTGVLRQQRPASRKDASTLTEDSNHEEEQSLAPPRHCGRLGRPLEEQEKQCLKELELMEGERHRHTGVDLKIEKRRSSKPGGREKKENPRDSRGSRRSKALTNHNDEEFATGLKIGALDTEDYQRRKKERYRQELEEQIAEQHRNRKREKDLELKVAATGVNDPEKQLDRIRQFGLSRRKPPRGSESSTTAEDEPSSRGAANNERTGVGDRALPPLELPHMAFQSPLLQYSSYLDGGGRSPTTQSGVPPLPRSIDIPRVPWFPPTTLTEAYRSPYGELHPYLSSRNLLNPSMAYYGHLSVPGADPLMSYWNVPPVGAMPNQFGDHSPHSQRGGSSFPEPPVKASSEAALDSQVKVFPSERSRSARERIVSYREALKQQGDSRRRSNGVQKIQEQQEQKLLEREEVKRYEAQLEADMKNHQPWGRGGGGAPLRDSTGNLIADLNQMHKVNEETYSNPKQQQKRAIAAMTVPQTEFSDPKERVSGFTHVHTPQFARGNVFPNQPSQQQMLEQDKYKADLKHQIDEKMSKKAEERERIRLEDEKEEKRLAEQRARIQREYEEEQEKKKQKEMEQKAKNEELIHLAEQRRKEAERKKDEAEKKENAALRRQYERERQARMEEAHREPSPPIPTLQRTHGQYQTSPRPPTVDSQRSSAQLSERSLSGLQSPPVPAVRNHLRAAGDQRDVISALSALKRQLRSEQKRLEGHLRQYDREEVESSLSDRQQERPPVDVFDMAMLRRQVLVRRPNSTKLEPRNLQQIHDSLQLNHTEYCDLPPPQQNNCVRSVMRRSSRGSLLDSESTFIDPLGNAFGVPCIPEQEKSPLLSARERRRLAKHSQRSQLQDQTASSQDQHDNYAGGVQQEADPSDDDWSQDRAGLVTALSRHGNAAGILDLSDDDSTATDPWMRPGTSDTLKYLDQPSRRKHLMT